MSTLDLQQDGGAMRLRFGGTLTIVDVSSLRDELLRTMDAPPAPVRSAHLDLSEVAEADSAGVQLIVSTTAWLQGLQVQTLLAASSPTFEQVARSIGAADDIQCCGLSRETLPGVPS